MKRNVMIVGMAMALISALVYVLMGIGVMEVPDLTTDEAMPAFYYVIPVAYVIMGILIFFKRRWLLIILTIINAFTIVVFYAAYATQPDIMLSAPGLITKIAQILLEIGLIYLIITFKRVKPA